MHILETQSPADLSDTQLSNRNLLRDQKQQVIADLQEELFGQKKSYCKLSKSEIQEALQIS